MTNVMVTGVPHVKMNKIVFLLKSTFEKTRISKNFWIQEFLNDHDTNLIKMTVTFDNEQAAYDAVKILHGFVFRQGNAKYPFSARVIQNRQLRSPSPYQRYRERTPVRHYERSDRRFSRGRSRSRSPLHHRADANDLDLEIELLRKRRLIIEEERRLLLERKKLELVKEFGTNATKEFDYLEGRDRDRDFGRRYERERRRSVDRFRRRSIERERFPRRKRSPPKPKAGLPMFVLPCKILMDSMQSLVSDNTSTHKESEILLKLIKTTLRKRIAVALEGKARMATSSIVSLYRKLYPESADEDLVKKLAKNIKGSHMPDLSESGNKKIGKKIDQEVKQEEKGTNEQKNNGEEKAVGADTENNAEATVKDAETEVVETAKDNEMEDSNNLTEEVEDTKTASEKNEENCEKGPEQNSDVNAVELLLENTSSNEKEDWVEGETDWNEGSQDAIEDVVLESKN